MRWLAMAILGAVLLTTSTSAAAEKAPLPKVRKERPRIFLRREAWDGPSVEQIKKWMVLPEYKARMAKLEDRIKIKSGSKNMKLAVKYLLLDDTVTGRQVLDRFMGQRSGGHSPSYWGIKDQRMAATYDWLYDHPDFTPEMKKDRAAYLEMRCRGNTAYLKNQKENPYYSRFSGALAGLTACALAIYGDHPEAEKHLRFAYDCFREKMSSIRRSEDGATQGSSYGYHHEFTDLANLVAAWRSATDWDAAKWVKEKQGNWLERQMLFQIWMTYPNGRFVKDGDGWGRGTNDRVQYRMSIDAITGMYKNGFGRRAADLMHKRWGLMDYHAEYMWQWFVHNNPDVKPRPLSDLGRTAVFSPNLHGIVAWRDRWDTDATIIHVRAGEGVDTHSTWDQGKFIIYRQRPLAHKNGDYIGFMSPVHRYYKSPWSANCVVFTGTPEAVEKADRQQKPFITNPSARFPEFRYSSHNPWWPRGLFSYEAWQALRKNSTEWAESGRLYATLKPMGRLLEHETNDTFARCRIDLDHVRRKRDGGVWTLWEWERELVFLGYKYLVVLDRVKPDPQFEHRWTLHTIHEPKVDGDLVIADNGPARLFCKTLLPANATLTKVGGPGRECDLNGANMRPKGWTSETFKKMGPGTHMGAWRLDVRPPAQTGERTYLHVLYPTDTKTDSMPACSSVGVNGDLIITVGDLTYTFKPRK